MKKGSILRATFILGTTIGAASVCGVAANAFVDSFGPGHPAGSSRVADARVAQDEPSGPARSAVDGKADGSPDAGSAEPKLLDSVGNAAAAVDSTVAPPATDPSVTDVVILPSPTDPPSVSGTHDDDGDDDEASSIGSHQQSDNGSDDGDDDGGSGSDD